MSDIGVAGEQSCRWIYTEADRLEVGLLRDEAHAGTCLLVVVEGTILIFTRVLDEHGHAIDIAGQVGSVIDIGQIHLGEVRQIAHFDGACRCGRVVELVSYLYGHRVGCLFLRHLIHLIIYIRRAADAEAVVYVKVGDAHHDIIQVFVVSNSRGKAELRILQEHGELLGRSLCERWGSEVTIGSDQYSCLGLMSAHVLHRHLHGKLIAVFPFRSGFIVVAQIVLMEQCVGIISQEVDGLVEVHPFVFQGDALQSVSVLDDTLNGELSSGFGLNVVRSQLDDRCLVINSRVVVVTAARCHRHTNEQSEQSRQQWPEKTFVLIHISTL